MASGHFPIDKSDERHKELTASDLACPTNKEK